MMYIKSAVLSSMLALVLFCGLMYGQCEILNAFFIVVMFYVFLYFCILAVIEEMRKREM